jgi:hypothetical protein
MGNNLEVSRILNKLKFRCLIIKYNAEIAKNTKEIISVNSANSAFKTKFPNQFCSPAKSKTFKV